MDVPVEIVVHSDVGPAIAGAGYEVVFKGFLLLLAGIPVYEGIRWRQRGSPTTGALTGTAEQPTAAS